VMRACQPKYPIDPESANRPPPEHDGARTAAQPGFSVSAAAAAPASGTPTMNPIFGYDFNRVLRRPRQGP
jgi:hypothetical protein